MTSTISKLTLLCSVATLLLCVWFVLDFRENVRSAHEQRQEAWAALQKSEAALKKAEQVRDETENLRQAIEHDLILPAEQEPKVGDTFDYVRSAYSTHDALIIRAPNREVGNFPALKRGDFCEANGENKRITVLDVKNGWVLISYELLDPSILDPNRWWGCSTGSDIALTLENFLSMRTLAVDAQEDAEKTRAVLDLFPEQP